LEAMNDLMMRPREPGPTTTAPAPSPKSMQVARSVQSVKRELVSEPMIRA
jgi:hypothetical protein